MKHSIPITGSVKFNVDDKMVIIDPCYVDSPDDIQRLLLTVDRPLGVVLEDCAGDWLAEIDISDEGSWGDRVSVLRAMRLNERGRPLGFNHVGNRGFELVHDDNGVDSGQMYIGGLENLPLDYERLLFGYRDPNKPDADFHEAYVNRNILAAEGGVVSSTGYGDGSYPVYVARDIDGRPVCVEVRFLEDEEEDSEYNNCERCGREIDIYTSLCASCERHEAAAAELEDDDED